MNLSRKQTRASVLLFLSISTLFFAVLFALTKPNLREPTVIWDSSIHEPNAALRLTRKTPEKIRISWSAPELDLSRERMLLDLGGIRITTRNSNVELFMRQGPTSEWGYPSLLFVAPKIPKQQVMINLHDRVVCHRVDTPHMRCNRIYLKVSPYISKIELPERNDNPISKLEIDLKPVGIRDQGARIPLALVTLLLSVTTVYLLLRNIGGLSKLRRRATMKPRLSAVDVMAFLSLVAVVVASPSYYDDGWVLQRVDSFLERNVFASYYENRDAWLPQGFWAEIFLSFLRQLGATLLHLRVSVAFCLFITWLIIRQIVILTNSNRSRVAEYVMLSAFMTFSLGWLMTIRAEPFVLLFTSAALLCALKYRYSGNLSWLLPSLVLAAVSLSLHQTGLVALIPAIISVTTCVQFFKNSSLNNRVTALALLLVSLALSLLVLFPQFDITTAGENIREFRTDENAYGTFFNELFRYQLLFNNSSALRIFSVLLLFISLLSAGLMYSTQTTKQRTAWISSLLMITALIGTSSKWQWHFGVYALPAVLLIGLIFSPSENLNREKKLAQAVFTCAIAVVAAVSLSITTGFNSLDLVAKNWFDFANLFGGMGQESLWLIIILFLSGFSIVNLYQSKRAIEFSYVCISAIVVVAPFAFTTSWIFHDATAAKGWSLSGQLLSETSGTSDSCGILDGNSFISDVSTLKKIRAVPSVITNGELIKDAIPDLSGISTGPLENLPVYGTWFSSLREGKPDESKRYVNQDSTVGKFAGNTVSVKGEEVIVFWTASGRSPNLQAKAFFLNSKEKVISEVMLHLPDSDFWKLNQLKVPTNAESAVVVIEDNHSEFGGWAATSDIYRPVFATASQLLDGRVSFAGPVELVRAPCIKPPANSRGIQERIEYVLTGTGYWSLDDLPALAITEIGCSAATPVVCLQHVNYRSAEFDWNE